MLTLKRAHHVPQSCLERVKPPAKVCHADFAAVYKVIVTFRRDQSGDISLFSNALRSRDIEVERRMAAKKQSASQTSGTGNGAKAVSN